MPLCRIVLSLHVGTCVKIAESTLLVGEKEDLSSLEKEYSEDDAIYQAKIEVSGCSNECICMLTMHPAFVLFLPSSDVCASQSPSLPHSSFSLSYSSHPSPSRT